MALPTNILPTSYQPSAPFSIKFQPHPGRTKGAAQRDAGLADGQ